jgi:tRNA(Ile)-lysidine synthase
MAGARTSKTISASEVKRLFAEWRTAPALILAVSGGPDSLALMWLAARWRRTLRKGPRLIAVTVDHGLRPEAAREARDVKQLAKSFGIDHRTMHWNGAKPKTGVPAAARDARYALLVRAARTSAATHILTAHTQDDQAETLLMRMSRGSGIGGLAAMARQSVRDGVTLARPFLHVPKSLLVATLHKAKIEFADDPTNRDPRFARPRLRALMPALAAEGADARNLARLAARLARANAALDLMTEGAARYLHSIDSDRAQLRGVRESYDWSAFSVLAQEIRVRLLLRALDRIGHEGPAELGKVEALVQALEAKAGAKSVAQHVRLKQTLAGAVVSLDKGRIDISPAPPRRQSAPKSR